MTQPKSSVSKQTERFDYMLSLLIGLSINLLTSFFQQNILSNIPLLIAIIILTLAALYYSAKYQLGIIFIALVNYVIFISLNFLSLYIQQDILKNTFTPLTAAIVVISPLVALIISALLKYGDTQPKKVVKRTPRRPSSKSRNTKQQLARSIPKQQDLRLQRKIAEQRRVEREQQQRLRKLRIQEQRLQRKIATNQSRLRNQQRSRKPKTQK